MNDTHTHGPPVDPLTSDTDVDTPVRTLPLGVPLSDDAVLIPVPPAIVADVERTVQHRRTSTGSDRYLILAQGLHDDPMNVVRRMTGGRYRFKRRRNGMLWIEHGQAVPELMSLRQAAAELERLTGEPITHETLRRWWERIWPDAPEPGTPVPPATFLPPA